MIARGVGAVVYKVQGDRIYAYRTVRIGGRVKTLYVGPAEFGRAIEAVEVERKRLEAERRRRDEAEVRALVEWTRAVGRLARQALEAAGYHRHKRGEWRKRRAMTTTIRPTPDAAAPAPRRSLSPGVVATLDRYRAKDAAAMAATTEAEAVQVLREAPTLVDFSGSPAWAVRYHLLKRNGVAGDELTRVATERKVEQIERDLAGPNPTAMERLLAQSAALCWLDLYSYQQSVEANGEGLTLAQATYRQRRLDSAQRRYLAAVRTLAAVRKLKLPDLTINLVDARTVNYHAAPTPPAERTTIEAG